MSTRTRVDNQMRFTDDPVVRRTFDKSGTLVYDPYVVDHGHEVGTRKVIVEILTPNFFALKKRGKWIAATDLTRTIDKCNTFGTSHITVGPEPSWNGYLTYDGDFVKLAEDQLVYFGNRYSRERFPVDEARLQRDLAVVKAFAAVNQSAVCGGEIIAEISKTAAMLRNPFSASENLLRQIKAKAQWFSRKRKSVNATRAVANAWLEERYGWTPLVMDMHEIMRLAGKVGTESATTVRVAKASSGSERDCRDTFDVNVIQNRYRVLGEYRAELRAKATAQIFFTYNEPALPASLVGALGLNARSLLSTAWNLTAYSFVVDWFTNVGDWLEAIMPKPGIVILDSFVTSKETFSQWYSGGQIQHVELPTFNTYYGTCNSSWKERVTVTRMSKPSLPPTPVWTGQRLSGNRIMDALSLTAQGLRTELKALRHP